MSGPVLIIDALSAGSGHRTSSRDSIGCGPRTVAGIFEKHSVRCSIRRVEDVLSKKSMLKRFNHLAVSAMTMDQNAVQMTVKYWRQMRPKGKVLLGGPIAADPTSILRQIRPDVLVVGEGEATLDEVLERGLLEDDIDLSAIQGIGFLESDKPQVNQTRALITSQEFSEKYHPSTTRIIDYPAYQACKVYVEILRGCSNFRRTKHPLVNGSQCTECSNCDSKDSLTRMDCPEDIPPGCGFCSVPGTWGPPRSRSAASIVEEVKELIDLGVHRVVLEAPGFLDYMRGNEPMTDPCYPPANLEAIEDLLNRLNLQPQVSNGDVHIAIENMKACLFTKEVAETLKRSMISSSPNIGLETGSEDHMRQIGKCGSPDDVVRAVKIAKHYDMKPFVYLIYGLPGETAESVEQSIRIMREVSEAGAERIILYGFRPLPGSAFAGYPESSLKDELGQVLRKEAEKINRQKKEQYIEKVVRGIAGEPSKTHHGFTMVYPLEEGPLMTVPGGFSAGTLLLIRVTKVLSSGLVAGEIVHDSDL
ncbi:MAG: B12-binding domain-containing radical SAM protein [Candidatus Thorarchaeota archaeon]